MMWQVIAKPLSWEKYICPFPPEGMETMARLGNTMEMANYLGCEWKKVPNSGMGMPSEQHSLNKRYISFWADLKGSLSSLMIYCVSFESLKIFMTLFSVYTSIFRSFFFWHTLYLPIKNKPSVCELRKLIQLSFNLTALFWLQFGQF